MKKFLKGFTLIELLIVIGILGILVAAVMLVLNPIEAQRKSRDNQRMKDLTTLQSIMEQVNADSLTSSLEANTSITTTACSNNWIGLDVCKYVTKVPLDPLNKTNVKLAGADAAASCTATSTFSDPAYYYIKYDGTSYEIDIRQESTSNCERLTNDGGNSNAFVETGTSTTHSLIADK
jgi:prepilin-type N-terminal cleavage/methylation domain-containing protein